ncbi:hypothetical protein AMECASPLE_014424 [Ameca splendens]|uniref:Uncharacterized protein n=1 Tax=Ameca splendens TaxID=208324 RepID=A0ABV0ZYD9_9TELE
MCSLTHTKLFLEKYVCSALCIFPPENVSSSLRHHAYLKQLFLFSSSSRISSKEGSSGITLEMLEISSHKYSGSPRTAWGLWCGGFLRVDPRRKSEETRRGAEGASKERFWRKVKEETQSAQEEDEAGRGGTSHPDHRLCTLKTAAEKNSHGAAPRALRI